MTDRTLLWRYGAAALALSLLTPLAPAQTGDYIVAVVNQELVTAAEVQQRMNRLRDESVRNRQPLPPAAALRKQVLDSLIDDRVLVTNARDSGATSTSPSSTVPWPTWRRRIS